MIVSAFVFAQHPCMMWTNKQVTFQLWSRNGRQNPACRLRLHMGQNTSIPVCPSRLRHHNNKQCYLGTPGSIQPWIEKTALSADMFCTCFALVLLHIPKVFNHMTWVLKVIESQPHKGNFTLLFVHHFAANCRWSEKHYYYLLFMTAKLDILLVWKT